MADQVQIQNRVNGAAGSGPSTGAKVGNLRLNFPGAAGTTGLPELWAFDGSAWRRVNPPAGAITTQSIDLNTPGGADIGAAAAAWIAANAAFTGDIVIGTYGTPAQAYVLTNPSAPGTAGSWTSLGGAVSFADATEIHAGTDTTKAINSAILRGETLNTPSGAGGTADAGDADKLVRLDANGQIASGFLSLPSSTTVGGVIDASNAAQTAPASPATGEIHFVSVAGTLTDTSWDNAKDVALTVGDILLYTGTNWEAIRHDPATSPYVKLAGSTMTANAKVEWPGAASAEGGNTLLDLKGGTIDNAVIDCGTF